MTARALPACRCKTRPRKSILKQWLVRKKTLRVKAAAQKPVPSLAWQLPTPLPRSQEGACHFHTSGRVEMMKIPRLNDQDLLFSLLCKVPIFIFYFFLMRMNHFLIRETLPLEMGRGPGDGLQEVTAGWGQDEWRDDCVSGGGGRVGQVSPKSSLFLSIMNSPQSLSP